MNSHPPSWAQSLLPFVVRPQNRDGVAGDLLEEYHEVQVAQRGERQADRWYTRQVLFFLWRAARWWGLALGTLIAVRGGFDIYLPTHDYYVRSLWTTYLAMSLYAACGVHAGWLYARIPSGALVGAAAAVIGSVIALGAPLLFLAVVLARGAHAPDGLWEALDVPAPVLVVFGAVLGSLGAAIGRAAGGLGTRRARA